MVLIKKVEKKEIEKQRKQIIEKGGDVAADVSNKQWMNFTCRMTKKMRREIDEAVERTVGLCATGWVLQAIQEKLKREIE